MFVKINKTICAIGNIGPDSHGKIIIGVADKESLKNQIEAQFSICAKKIGKKYVVGVSREAGALGIDIASYFSKIKNEIKKSALSNNIKSDVLANIEFHDFYGLGIIVVAVPSQKSVAYLGDDIYYREADSTKKAVGAKHIAAIVGRFK